MQTNKGSFFRRTLTALAVTACLVAPQAVSAQDSGEPINWKAVSNTRNSLQFTEKWQWLADQLNERTDGRMTLEVSSFPELGLTGQELIRMLDVNLMDMAEVVTGYVSGDVPLMEGVQLPGVYRDYDQAREGYEAWMAQVVEPRAEVLGGKPIATFAFSSQYLWSKFPVNSLDDLEGKKIRVFAVAQADYFTALGAEPVSIPLAEVYTALERGVVDAVVTGPESGAGMKLWEVVDHVVDLRLGVGAGYVVVSQDSLDALPDDVRAVFEELQPELNELGWSLGTKDTKAGLDEVQANGITATIPAKDEWQAELDEIARTVVVPNWAKRAGPESAGAFNEVLGPLVGFTIE